MHIDVESYQKAANTIPDIPELQHMSFPELLGMSVSPSNVLEVGHAAYAEAFLRAMMPGVNTAVYWTPHYACSHFDDELKTCIKRVLAQYNDERLR